MKTIIMDIDGCLLKHRGGLSNTLLKDTKILDNVLEKLNTWERKRYNIILITGRKESMRKFTEEELIRFGVFWDQLIMGVGGGERVLINDCKPNGDKTAFAINLKRNVGLGDIKDI